MTTQPTDLIVGFDTRVLNAALVAASWTAQRRDRYLIRVDARSPISVDAAVAPSIFAFGDTAPNAAIGQVRIPEVGWHRTALRIWEDLSQMTSAVRGLVSPFHRRHAIFVAITTPHHTALSSCDVRWQQSIQEPVAPRQLDTDWSLMGYDLADRFFLSGLSNCGLTSAEYAAIRPTLAPQMNDFALFSRLEDATAFLPSLNQLVPEHAPFYAFGIWRLDKLETGESGEYGDR